MLHCGPQNGALELTEPVGWPDVLVPLLKKQVTVAVSAVLFGWLVDVSKFKVLTQRLRLTAARL